MPPRRPRMRRTAVTGSVVVQLGHLGESNRRPRRKPLHGRFDTREAPTTAACNSSEFPRRFSCATHKLWMTCRSSSAAMHKLRSICVERRQQDAFPSKRRRNEFTLRPDNVLHSLTCVLNSEIVLNVTFACDDVWDTQASLLDFVEKLIHRFQRNIRNVCV